MCPIRHLLTQKNKSLIFNIFRKNLEVPGLWKWRHFRNPSWYQSVAYLKDIYTGKNLEIWNVAQLKKKSNYVFFKSKSLLQVNRIEYGHAHKALNIFRHRISSPSVPFELPCFVRKESTCQNFVREIKKASFKHSLRAGNRDYILYQNVRFISTVPL